MQNRSAITALVVAGTLWGLTVALSKLSLSWLAPSWLAVLRFALAAPVLLYVGRGRIREALSPRVILSGALGFGVSVLLQNAGIEHTSVSHAAIIVGALPVIVALISAGLGHSRPGPRAWIGYVLALLGIILVARGGGGGATAGGDVLVFASVAVSSLFIALQPLVLRGRDVAAVTAVQFAAGALIALPVALLTAGVPAAPAHVGPVAAFVALALVGTVLPFWLFAYGQAHVSADIAGVFVNLEPLVGAAVGWTMFGDPLGMWQVLGVAGVIAGIVLSVIPRQALVDSVEPRWA